MKKLKKLWAAFTLICFLFTLMPAAALADTTTTANQAGDVVTMQIGSNVVYKNSDVMHSDVAPVIVEGRTLVPVRIVVEALGGEVDWNNESRTVGIVINGNRMELVIDQLIPGFGTGAIIKDGRTMVPVRYIMEYVGAEVVYKADTKEVIIRGTGITNEKTSEKAKEYKVTFEMNYSNKGTYKTVTVEDGKTVDSPAKPSISGRVFRGWYDNAACEGSAYDFSTPVHGDLTLYAKWLKSGSGNGSSGKGNVIVDKEDKEDKDDKEETPDEPVKGENVSQDVTVDENNKVASDVTMQGENATASVAAGTQLEAGTDKLTLSISELDDSQSEANVKGARSLDVHVEGIAEDNTVPVIIGLGQILPPGQNFGNPKVYHVENGVSNAMTQVETEAELDDHNEFYYDPVDGSVTVAMASFSEIALVANTENGWNGKILPFTYDKSKPEDTVGSESNPYIIANADQLVYFAKAVGGMWYDREGKPFLDENGNLLCDENGISLYGEDGKTPRVRNSYTGKHFKLIADVNLGDKDNANESLIFHPIGYYYTDDKNADGTTGDYYSTVYSFEGTFDGGGHTISNFYQNTWEIKGDYDGNYYDVAMGLFGYVKGGTVKNLTVDNFSSDGEYTPTGVIAAYADGNSTFENIAITNCNPRVYNTGNGGIIGIAGSTSKSNDDHITLKNITVDNSNKISALWGSWDVACGGLVGMYRGNVDGSGAATDDTISFVNCHVAAQIDVNNDVCANYQYYAYRYAGMIIGSVRHNTTVDGKTIPDMTGIKAEKCTVNFGDWNDYYYCELVANTLASYTHDYQFSRLTQVDEVDVKGRKVTVDGKEIDIPTSGRYNYVVVNGVHATENATCYHFVDGEVWNHADAGKETVNGVEVDVEDNQHIYLEFNQLFTGYSWGVSSIGLKEYEGIAIKLGIDDGITEGDKEESVMKFKAKEGINCLKEGKTYKLSELFKEINADTIKNDAVTIGFTDIDGDETTVSAVLIENNDDWKESTVTFSNQGTVKITIQDYHFCIPTELTVDIADDEEIHSKERFAVAFQNTDKYLYRVGNKNEISISSLFKAAENVSSDDIGNIEINITNETLTRNQKWVYEAGTEWNNGTIDFDNDFTGLVTVTISDDSYSEALSLDLEVVDAVNVTEKDEWIDDTTSVLLDNITLTSAKRMTKNNALYGNGFTINATGAPCTGVEYDYQSYVIYLENSTLDNVIIEGMVYPEVGGSRDKDYSRALVMTSGDCVISNSFLTNTASPIRNAGNLELKNSVLKGGAYANMDIRNGHTILDNVTTINRAGEGIVTSEGNEAFGLGVVVYQEGGSEDLKITIRNELKQYNTVSKDQVNSYGGNIQKYSGLVFSFDKYLFDYESTDWINTGIISMNDYFSEDDLVDERADNEGYFKTAKKMKVFTQSRNCLAYSNVPDARSISSEVQLDERGQGAIAPIAEFDFDEKNYHAKTEGSNYYCYEDGGTVYISMDEGDKFIWDTSILTVTKNGQNLDYTVTMGERDYTGKTIEFNTSDEYEVKYTYTDEYNYMNNGTYSVDYEKIVKIIVTVVEKNAKPAEFSFGANGTEYGSKTVQIGDKTYVMPNVTATVSGKIGSKTINGTTVYYPITEMYTSDGKTTHTSKWYACFPIFKDVLQIVDYAELGTGDAVTYNQITVTKVEQIPSTLKAVDPKTAFLYSMNANNYAPPTDPTAVSGAVCYTCNRNGLDGGNSRNEENTVAEYTYTDNMGNIYYYYIGYHCAAQTGGSSGSCVTPDTLITLADGSQERVDQLTGDELLLVWNLETGTYDVAPMVFVDSDEESEYNVIYLNFSDDSEVKVIYEHGFFDIDLGEYVYITEENYDDYIGHRFVKQADIEQNTWKVVTLTDAYVEAEETTAWSPVTAEHLCYYTNGVLSMPGGIEGLFNIFEVDTDIMAYDAEKMAQDIEEYGLFTYDDFEDLIPEIAYEVFNGDILRVAIGKGMLTWEDIEYLAERYMPMM